LQEKLNQEEIIRRQKGIAHSKPKTALERELEKKKPTLKNAEKLAEKLKFD